MERNLIILVVLGLAACGALFFLVDVYAMLIGVVVVIALAMSLFIMQDSAMSPNVEVDIKEDGRGIRVQNKGNAKAVSIRITLIPHDLHYKIPFLDEDAETTFSTDTMIERVKFVVEFQNERGDAFSKTRTISVFDKPDEDLLKPAFPLFKWK
ncbi:MAG: hypothetical protein MUC66_05445 [Methanolinea sp.]|nr:hypothetical protein [Methanolinea sp.]